MEHLRKDDNFNENCLGTQVTDRQNQSVKYLHTHAHMVEVGGGYSFITLRKKGHFHIPTRNRHLWVMLSTNSASSNEKPKNTFHGCVNVDSPPPPPPKKECCGCLSSVGLCVWSSFTL